MTSVNSEFLRPGYEVLANLAGLTEAVLHIDPGSALSRLRIFAEDLTEAVFKEEQLPRLPQSSFFDLVKNPGVTDCGSKSIIYQLPFYAPGLQQHQACPPRSAISFLKSVRIITRFSAFSMIVRPHAPN